MTANERIIRDFIAAWSTLDADRIVGFFAEDGIYHNMPIAPVKGRERLKPFITGFIKDWAATDWEIVSLVSSGDTVIAERVDRSRVGTKTVDLPCCGVFEMKDGKIQVWRDYFDMATYTRALTG
ncbi:MAG: nuclear transport factor 2 family protein [Alphaproteobacteria bacterium]|nr:nuclear transport factor 2 family protein [Alphaproteobacteria bacterium]